MMRTIFPNFLDKFPSFSVNFQNPERHVLQIVSTIPLYFATRSIINNDYSEILSYVLSLSTDPDKAAINN
jgi:hypothetical protein